MGPLLGPIVISGLISACGSSAAPPPPPDTAVPLEVADAAAPDAPWPWAGQEDALGQAHDLGVDHVVPQAYARPSYTHLADTGFFADPAQGTESPALVSFAPNHVLWSDGAEKRRWIALP